MIREVIDRARSVRSEAEQARQRELEAQAAAEAARRAREAAERAVPAAEADAERAERELEKAQQGHVTAIEGHMARARSLAASPFAAHRVEYEQRKFARDVLHAGGPNAVAAIFELARRDAICASYFAAGEAARRLIEQIGDDGLVDSVFEQVDALELESWKGFTDRVRAMAGEA